MGLLTQKIVSRSSKDVLNFPGSGASIRIPAFGIHINLESVKLRLAGGRLGLLVDHTSLVLPARSQMFIYTKLLLQGLRSHEAGALSWLA